MPWRKLMSQAPFEGIFRRQIDLQRWDEQTVVGWLEDESHHFGVTVEHDGGIIRDVRTAAARFPWSTCPAAGEKLHALRGRPLFRRCGDLGSLLRMERHCTHLFDLASLVIAHACTGRVHRRYHGTVRPLGDVRTGAPSGLLRASLLRDEHEVLAWDLDGDMILSPPPFEGRGILEGFRQWTDGLPDELAEEALVLRRVAFVSKGRRISIEHASTAAQIGQGPVCFTFQPQTRDLARRIPDTRRRYDNRAEAMLGKIGTKP